MSLTTEKKTEVLEMNLPQLVDRAGACSSELDFVLSRIGQITGNPLAPEANGHIATSANGSTNIVRRGRRKTQRAAKPKRRSKTKPQTTPTVRQRAAQRRAGSPAKIGGKTQPRKRRVVKREVPLRDEVERAIVALGGKVHYKDITRWIIGHGKAITVRKGADMDAAVTEHAKSVHTSLTHGKKFVKIGSGIYALAK